MRRNRKTRGFTLVEVILVITIIGILATVFVLTIGSRPDKAKIGIAETQVGIIVSRLEEYKLAVGEYPTEEQGGIKALLTKPTFEDETLGGKWAGPYIKKKQLKDPWGEELGYEVIAAEDDGASGETVHVWSYGPNKTDDNGDGDDIKSWEDEDDVE